MKENNMNENELTALCTQEGAFAVLLGYLKSERGKIAPSVFNKFANQLGYPKQSKHDLVELTKEIQENEVLMNLYVKGFDREIRLDELPNVMEEKEVLKESNVFAKITNFLVDNEDNNARLRELRKLQREGVYMELLMRGLREHIVDELKGMPRAKYLQTPVIAPEEGEKERALILLLSDWHIGALVFNEDTGGYSFEKLVGSVQNILQQVVEAIDELNVNQVYVFHVGDVIEHISMRNVNQAFEAEFPATEQISKGERLIVDMLTVLSKKVHVTFGMVSGNHDRFSGDKNSKVYNDTAVYLILDNLFMLQDKLGQLPNVTLIDNREDTYSFTIKIAGKNIKVAHGDHEKKKDDVKIPKHIKEEPIDYYIMGHIHTTRIVQEDYARFHIYVGSTMGANNYSKELNLPTTAPAQMLMILTEGKKTPIFIPLFDI